MNKIVYRVYYDSNEAAKSAASCAPPAAENVAQVLQQFPQELEAMLSDADASVTCESPTKEADSIIAVIESTASEEQVGRAVETCLSTLGLCGTRLQRV